MVNKNIEIEWTNEHWDKIANKAFLPLVHNTDRYLILYGGRGSSKSRFTATKIIYRMLTEEYFRCIIIRNIAANIKDSAFQQLLDVIEDLGLSELFTHTVSPLSITCLNGNKILARGLDNPSGIKSIADVSCIWWEEDIPSESAWITVSTSIRTTKSSYIQELFSINPEVEGHYEDNWFWKRFFKNNLNELSFRNTTIIKGKKDKEIELNYTVHHSTYKNNRFLSEQYIATLEAMKTTNPYYYTVYVNGLFGSKENNQAFYKSFQRGKHVYSDLNYDPELPLHISFDFNVVPHMSALIFQIEGKEARCIDEVLTKTPDNNTKGICKEIKRRYPDHETGLFIYGDATGKHQDTRTENGVNDFTIIQGELKYYNPIARIPNKNPPLVIRGQFINNIFVGEKDIDIKISDKCTFFINDLLFGKEAEDGTKHKEKK